MVPMGGNKPRVSPKMVRERPEVYVSMGVTAENVSRKYEITREMQDAFALESHRRALAAISEGRTIAEPLEASNVFPGMVVQMIAVGEQTGAMDAMLSKIADFYDDEVDSAVAGLTSMLEPIMMVFMGGSIGTILIAMYLPIFTIADTIT